MTNEQITKTTQNQKPIAQQKEGFRKDAMAIHACESWKPGPMDSVKSRSTRRMTFDANGHAILPPRKNQPRKNQIVMKIDAS